MAPAAEAAVVAELAGEAVARDVDAVAKRQVVRLPLAVAAQSITHCVCTTNRDSSAGVVRRYGQAALVAEQMQYNAAQRSAFY